MYREKWKPEEESAIQPPSPKRLPSAKMNAGEVVNEEKEPFTRASRKKEFAGKKKGPVLSIATEISTQGKKS